MFLGLRRSVVSSVLRPGTYHARIFAGNAAGFGAPAVFGNTALATPVASIYWDDTFTPAHLSVIPIQVWIGLLIHYQG